MPPFPATIWRRGRMVGWHDLGRRGLLWSYIASVNGGGAEVSGQLWYRKTRGGALLDLHNSIPSRAARRCGARGCYDYRPAHAPRQLSYRHYLPNGSSSPDVMRADRRRLFLVENCRRPTCLPRLRALLFAPRTTLLRVEAWLWRWRLVWWEGRTYHPPNARRYRTFVFALTTSARTPWLSKHITLRIHAAHAAMSIK